MRIIKSKRKIPVVLKRGQYDVYNEKNHTRHIKGYRGYFLGRYDQVPLRFSDNVRYVRMKKSLDINHDNIPDLYEGQIVGRIKNNVREIPKKLIIKVKLSKGRRR